MISRPILSGLNFPNIHVSQGINMHNNMLPDQSENNLVSPQHTNTTTSSHHQSTSLLYNLSVLKDKLTQMQTLAGVLVSSSGHGPDQAIPGDPDSCSAIASMNSIIQEFIVTASSMMITCQHMLLNLPPPGTTTTTTNDDNNRYCNSNTNNNLNIIGQDRGQSTMFSSNSDDWFAGESFDNNNSSHHHDHDHVIKEDDNLAISTNKTHNVNNNHSDHDSDIIELDAADLLAKYTHYCQICGKGFKRDANLRMHMRAHGDEYKSSAALSNPMKNKRSSGSGLMMMTNNTERPKKYSCPQQGCRWNQRHAKFQPLKSMICVKNHYKRSHCPKMYVCKRCNSKQFSVLSDLRTHEKHCGDLKWQCSCGTTFSRKDKLMGHVALFVGHTPAIITSTSVLSYSSLEHC